MGDGEAGEVATRPLLTLDGAVLEIEVAGAVEEEEEEDEEEEEGEEEEEEEEEGEEEAAAIPSVTDRV